MNDTNIVYKARLHWILFFWPLLLLSFSIILGLKIATMSNVAFFLALFSLIWGAMVWVTYHFSYLIIKKKQVILCTGVLVRQLIDIPLNKIESIDIRQSLIGSLFHYGSLVITGTGGTRQFINYLNKPLTCRRYIEQLMHE